MREKRFESVVWVGRNRRLKMESGAGVLVAAPIRRVFFGANIFVTHFPHVCECFRINDFCD